MKKDEVIIPKGTVVKLNGFPCELGKDTQVISSVLARETIGQDYRLSISQVEPRSLKPFQAPTPVNSTTSSSSPESK
jgi:hypothetical protein